MALSTARAASLYSRDDGRLWWKFLIHSRLTRRLLISSRPPGAASAIRGVLLAGLVALFGLVLLISLGIWQLHRLAWKEALIARIEARSQAAPVPLPPPSEWPTLKPDDYEYRHVDLRGRFDRREALVFRGSGPGRGRGAWLSRAGAAHAAGRRRRSSSTAASSRARPRTRPHMRRLAGEVTADRTDARARAAQPVHAGRSA